MNIDAMIARLDRAYSLTGHVHAADEELDALALARQELRNLFEELRKAKQEEVKSEETT